MLVGCGLQNMGLDDDEYHFLTQHVDTVMHAAIVNLMCPYDALVAGNVRGTSNIVSFDDLIKAIHACHPTPCSRWTDGTARLESDTLDDGWVLHSGYAQSNGWASSLCVRLDSGLPGAICRCGNIGGHDVRRLEQQGLQPLNHSGLPPCAGRAHRTWLS